MRRQQTRACVYMCPTQMTLRPKFKALAPPSEANGNQMKIIHCRWWNLKKMTSSIMKHRKDMMTPKVKMNMAAAKLVGFC